MDGTLYVYMARTHFNNGNTGIGSKGFFSLVSLASIHVQCTVLYSLYIYIYIYAVRCSINNIVHNIKSSRPKLTFRLFHIIGFTLWVCVCARLCACECITFGLFHRQTTKFRLIHFYTTATNTVILFVPSCNAVTDCCSRISTKIHYSEQYYFFSFFRIFRIYNNRRKRIIFSFKICIKSSVYIHKFKLVDFSIEYLF